MSAHRYVVSLLWTLLPGVAFAEMPVADVVGVTVAGAPGDYQFSIGIRSPDLGCQQFADWWEVLDDSGKLLYRRVLLHSHVEEQPFTRAGGPVPIAADATVWVRAHMKPSGYGGVVYRGSVQQGFAAAPMPEGFAPGVDRLPPLPESCAF